MPYQDETKQELMELLMRYFKESQGNRLTSFAINGLVGEINSLLEKNKIPEDKPTKNRSE